MIYKAPSIYNLGGGGGYSDGGELIDGDFIKVENNTVSSYENTTRDPINFYFEVKDGEILNSVVELTTEVNATVNVYVVKNGIYYILGNVGGNTVNAGDDYNLSVVGNSFMLEVVTPSQDEPAAIEFNGKIYSLVNVNGLLWTTENIKLAAATYSQHGYDFYYKITSSLNLDNAIREINNNCRLPTNAEIENLISYFGGYNTTCSASLCSSLGWKPEAGNGNNSSGLNFLPNSYCDYGGEFISLYEGWESYCLGKDGWLFLKGSSSSPSTGASMTNQYYYPARFVVDLN